MTAPERIWMDEFGGWNPIDFSHRRDRLCKPYILATPEALAKSPEVQMMVMAERDRCGLAVANVEIGFYDGISGDWHPMSGPSIISAACAAIRAGTEGVE